MLEIKPTVRLALEDNITLQGISELEHYYAFNISSGDQFQLNHTAYWVIGSIEKGLTFQELTDKFAGDFDLSLDTAKEDLTQVIQFALENNIIKESLT